MGLLFADNNSKGDFATKAEEKFLQQLGCKACPLDSTPGKIDATGSKTPDIYILGEAAGLQEEEQRKQFVGTAGQLLRGLLPREALPLIRWNNILNCRPPKNRNPTPHEMNCCKLRVVGDIERSKPKMIWGFGNVPLHWVSGFSGISYWRGRRVPVKIGNHTCWYYAFLHPSFLNRIARDNGQEFGSEDERMTLFDIERAFADLEDLPKPVVHSEGMARANVECITDLGQIAKALQWASRQPAVGLDYETNRLRPYEEGAKILTAAVGTLERSYAFPLLHPGSGYSKQQLKDVHELWKRFLMAAACKKLVHNLVFEMEWSGYFFGRETLRARSWEDTANAAAIVDERAAKRRDGPFSLAFLVQQYFGFNLKKLSDVDRSKLEFTPLNVVLNYNGMDAKYHFGLWEKLWARIEDEGLEIPYRLACRRVPTVALSQLKGVPVDQEVSKKLQKKYQKKIDAARALIDDLSVVKKFVRQRGKEFNPASSKDLPYLMSEMLGCKEVRVVDKYSKKEKLSTEETVLNKIIRNHPKGSDASELSKALIQFREASGTKSKYVDSLIWGEESCVIYPDGLIHTNFNTYFAETGRLCVAEDTILLTSLGPVKIADLDLKGKHRNAKIRTHLGRWRRITKLWFKGFEQMYRVKTGSGAYIDCTSGHRLLTQVGWKDVASLKVGDKVSIDSGSFVRGNRSRSVAGVQRELPIRHRALYYSNQEDCIVGVEAIGIQSVWDITVKQDHSYHAQGLIHHNSSDAPNLQNFPYRDEGTKEVRKAIAALLGRLMLKFDYGQIEARVIAMATKDPVFCKALWEKFDIHGDWAERLAYEYPARIGGKKFLKDKKVLKDFRTDVKNQWTFPLFFGARDASVANYLQIPIDIITPQVREFWKMFPASKGWQNKTIKFYQEYGYVETLTGRRRHGPLTTNQILNSPIQGTAAEIVLDAMSRLSELEDEELQPEINIHDDLTFVGVKTDRVDIVAEKVIDTMINTPFKFINVPITVEAAIGKNWCELEEFGTFSSDTWNK